MIRLKQFGAGVLVSSLGFSGTSVGNGGDPLLYYFEATRYSLTETIKLVLQDPAEVDRFCQRPELSTAQSEFCRGFFLASARRMLSLNQGSNKTSFVLRDQPLYVIGPDGQPMSVAARTSLGPEGAIEFHRDSVKLAAPQTLLMLMAHEFFHKVPHAGSHVTDNDPIGPFHRGRELIDHAAASLVEAARRGGKIGSQFGVRDSFVCKVSVGSSNFGVRVSSPRVFRSTQLLNYETSLGRNPTDGFLFVPESYQSDLVFRMIISEGANCAQLPSPNQERSLRLAIVRHTKDPKARAPMVRMLVTADETVASEEFPGVNPMCAENPSEFGISYGQVRFQCIYYGSEGTTIGLRPTK